MILPYAGLRTYHARQADLAEEGRAFWLKVTRTAKKRGNCKPTQILCCSPADPISHPCLYVCRPRLVTNAVAVWLGFAAGVTRPEIREVASGTVGACGSDLRNAQHGRRIVTSRAVLLGGSAPLQLGLLG